MPLQYSCSELDRKLYTELKVFSMMINYLIASAPSLSNCRIQFYIFPQFHRPLLSQCCEDRFAPNCLLLVACMLKEASLWNKLLLLQILFYLESARPEPSSLSYIDFVSLPRLSSFSFIRNVCPITKALTTYTNFFLPI